MYLEQTKKCYYEVDLHCHTTASDGILTPSELVESAANLGLKGIGITDHDTISGWEEAEEAGKYFNIEIIKGIELNTEYSGKEVHILGYEIDPYCQTLQDRIKTIRDARVNRMRKILKKIKELGIEITEIEIQNIAKGESIGRPHIAQALVDRGIVKTTKEAFDRFIGLGAPAFVPRYKLEPEEAIELIRQAGGVAVLAHPGISQLRDQIPKWIKHGLQGIEVIHSEHTKEDEFFYQQLAKKHNLLTTGGSDFHGESRKPGVNIGGWGVNYSVVEKIRAYTNHTMKNQTMKKNLSIKL